MEKNIWEEITNIAWMLKFVHSELVDLSEEIEYRYQEDKECSAGDDLKLIATSLMDEIQKLYPIDY